MKLNTSKKTIKIFEVGFGTGLNAFLSLIYAERFGFHVNYTAIEAFPVKKEITEQLNYSLIIEEGKYRSEFNYIHQSDWNKMEKITKYFSLQKDLCHFNKIQYINCFDLVYFDAFAPDEQSESWETPLLAIIYESMKKEAVLLTYCAQGQFRRNLKSLGFEIESLPGPKGKREITRGLKLNENNRFI